MVVFDAQGNDGMLKNEDVTIHKNFAISLPAKTFKMC